MVQSQLTALCQPIAAAPSQLRGKMCSSQPSAACVLRASSLFTLPQCVQLRVCLPEHPFLSKKGCTKLRAHQSCSIREPLVLSVWGAVLDTQCPSLRLCEEGFISEHGYRCEIRRKLRMVWLGRDWGPDSAPTFLSLYIHLNTVGVNCSHSKFFLVDVHLYNVLLC